MASWPVRRGLPLLCLLAGAANAGDWTFYRHDLQGTANAGEPLTAAQARALTVTRTFRVSGDTYSNPIVANGSLYFTAGDSNVHAIDLSTFQEKWRKKVSAAGPFLPCTPLSRADPVGAPAVVGNTVFVPGGDGVVYGLDAATGATLWQTRIADPPHVGDFLWSSMFPLQGKVYVGVSSLIDCVLVPGRLVALDQASGAVTGTFWADANHGPGGGIWTQQAYDAATDRIFATTGTIAKGQTSTTQPLADAFVAIDPATMTAVDHFSPLPNDTFVDDNDFGASPTLYDSPDGRHFVAATDKNGWVYAVDRDHLSNGIVWKYQISGPGASPDIGESSIVSAPYANGMLFVAGGKTVDGFPGAVVALDAFTGVPKWPPFHPDGYVLAGMTVAGDVLFVCASQSVNGNGILYALDQATGEVLYTLTAARMFGEPTWANGALYVGDATGVMLELKPDPAGPQPDFDLVMSPLTVEDVAGSSATFAVTVKPKNGFTGDVTLSTTRVPLLASGSFSPATVTATGATPYSSTLTISTDPSIRAIFEQVGISGIGGGKTRTAAGWFSVQNFALTATAAAAVQGGTATSTITIAAQNGFTGAVDFSASGLPPGTTASFNPVSALDATRLALKTSLSTPPGNYTVTVTGAQGPLSHTVAVPVVVTQPADFQVQATPPNQDVHAGGQAVFGVSISPTGNFAAGVSFSTSGLPSGTTASFSSGSDPLTEVLTVSVSPNTPSGSFIFLVQVSGGGLTHTAPLSLTVLPTGSFDVVLSAPAARVAQGSSAEVKITVSPHDGFTGAVTLAAQDLPAGLTAAFDPPQASGSSSLTLTASSSVAPGTYAVSVVGSVPGLSRTKPLSVEVVTADSSAKTGCTSAGSPGAGAALLAFLFVARAARRRRHAFARI